MKLIAIIWVVALGLFLAACSEEPESTLYPSGDGSVMAASMVNQLLSGSVYFSESQTYKYDGAGNYEVVTIACTKNPGVGPVQSDTLLSTVTRSPNKEGGLWEVTRPPDEIIKTKSDKEQDVIRKIAEDLSAQVSWRCKER